MDYVMYIQNGESLGYTEFEDYEKVYLEKRHKEDLCGYFLPS